MVSHKDLARSVANRFARENDRKWRQLASQIYQKVVETLKNAPLYQVEWVTSAIEDLLVYVVPLGSLGPEWKDYKITIGLSTESQGASFSSNLRGLRGRSKFLIRLGVRYPYPTLTDPISPEIKKVMLRNLKAARSVCIHEIVHFLDYVRIGQQGFDSGAQKGRERKEDMTDYYNSPVEMNAYFQQAASEYRDAVEKAAAEGDSWSLGNYFNHTVDYLWENYFQVALYPGFWKHLTPKNKRRIQKRSAQFIQRMKKYAAKRLLPLYKRDLVQAKEDNDEWEVESLQKSLAKIRKMGIR